MTRQPFLFGCTGEKASHRKKAIITYLRKIGNKAVYLPCTAIKYLNSVIYHFEHKVA